VGLATLVAVLAAAPLLFACDTTKLAAKTTAKVFDRGTPAFEEFYDYEIAGVAAQSTLLQLEGLLRTDPSNEVLLRQATQAYASYAYGWVEDSMEEHELAGRDVEADRARRRARSLYRRAFDLGSHWISLEHPGMDAATGRGLDGFRTWVSSEFQDFEDADMLFWTGYAWGSRIHLSLDDMNAVADLALARALVERSVELDPTYYHSAGLVFLGAVTSQSMGANLDEAQGYFERALSQTERKSLAVQYNMATSYAVMRQDRSQYLSLLAEVLEANDPLPEARLSNEIARRRAERAIRQVDQKF
jgi:hypothetical protein